MNTMVFRENKSRKLLVKCLATSLAFHAFALTYFYYSPLLLQSPFASLFGLYPANPTLLDTENNDFNQKNIILEEVFQKILVLSSHQQIPYDLPQMPKGRALAPNVEEVVIEMASLEENTPFAQTEIDYWAQSALEDHEEILPSELFGVDELQLPIVSQLQIDSPVSLKEPPIASLPLTGLGEYTDLMALSHFALEGSWKTQEGVNVMNQLPQLELTKIQTDSAPTVALISSSLKEVDHSRPTLFIPRSPALSLEKKNIPVPHDMDDFEHYGFPEMATAAEWNEDFDVDITFLPHPEGKGYIFSLSLSPNIDMASHSLKQTVYFILDRSNSVQKHRFAVFKRAILKALASMQTGDAFNILVMDKKLVSFSAENRAVNLKNIRAAEDFLDRQESGGLFSSSDIYSSLDKILPHIPESQDVHTAILLTDGKTSLNAARKQSAMKKWIEKNNGKVALYTCAVGRDNDLISLDMLASLSGGKLLYSDTHASFPRKLAKLLLDLRDPIAKNLIITATPHNPHSHVEFYQVGTQNASIYGHSPFVLVGQIDDPCAFDLIIQGRHKDNWIAIKKNISFVDGHKGDYHLEKEWNARHANVCYSKFLQEAKASLLQEAKEILKKSRLEIAYE